MMRKGILPLGFLAALLLLVGCHGYSYMSLRGSVGYGEASTIPYSQDYYNYPAPPYYYYPAYPYYYAYPYPPYYYYPYPYPYFFGGYYIYHFPSGPAPPVPGRRFRSSSGTSSSSSGEPSTGERRFKK